MIEVARPQDPSRGYRVEIRQEEDGSWTLLVPSLPGLVVVGESIGEAWGELPEVIDLWIEAAQGQGLTVPLPDADSDVSHSGKFMVRMPKTLHSAIARRADAEGISINLFCVTALTDAVARGGFHLQQPRVQGRFIAFDHWIESLETVRSDSAPTHVRYAALVDLRHEGRRSAGMFQSEVRSDGLDEVGRAN